MMTAEFIHKVFLSIRFLFAKCLLLTKIYYWLTIIIHHNTSLFEQVRIFKNEKRIQTTIIEIKEVNEYRKKSNSKKGEKRLLKIYITRHGETEWNIQKRLQGWRDSELTENGIKNAMSLGVRLKGVNFNTIYSSPSTRTMMTANLISADRDIPIIINSNLKEINMGDWEGKTHSYIEEHYPNEYFSFWNTPHLYTPINGETYIELHSRVIKALNEIKNHHDSGNVLIVTHTVVIKCLLAFFKNQPLEKLWEPPFIHDTSLSVVEIESENARIVLEGDISHREGIYK